VDTRRVLAINVPAISYGKTPQQVADFYKNLCAALMRFPGVDKTAFASSFPGATQARSALASNSPPTATCVLPAKKILAPNSAAFLRDFSPL